MQSRGAQFLAAECRYVLTIRDSALERAGRNVKTEGKEGIGIEKKRLQSPIRE